MTTADPVSGPTSAPWRDRALPVAERVELLLEQLTLAEKVGQLGSRWAGNDMQSSPEAGDPPRLP